jgi:selenocysteine lyase/cysteine desulfurase
MSFKLPEAKPENMLFSEHERQKLFPVVKHAAYLNNAAVAPLPDFVAKAYQQYIDLCSSTGEKHWESSFAVLEETRSLLARYLHSSNDEIAFTRNVSDGLSVLASGIDWQPGDEIVFADIEFPANVYPWLNLQKQGVKISYLKSINGRTGIEELKKAVSSSTRLVSLSSVQFFSGYRAELAEIGKFLAQRKILFCVDAVQHIGAFALNVKECNISFLAGACHKWLMCGEGLGFVYCRKDLAEKLTQRQIGWQSVQNWSAFFSHDLTLKPGALRFETGGMPVAVLYALHATLNFIKELGIENISGRILNLRQLVYENARKRGFQVVGNDFGAKNSSGIITFSIAPYEAAKIVEELAQNNIFVSAREGCVRVSPSYYNSKKEIIDLFFAIDKLVAK